jgi:hypothetical protein
MNTFMMLASYNEHGFGNPEQVATMTTERRVPNDDSRFLIDSEMTLAHITQVIALHPRTNGLFSIAASRFPPLRPGGCPSRCRLVVELGKNRKKLAEFLTNSRLDR